MTDKDNESKNDKFIRIAEARTNKIISMIALLGNCSNRSVYEYNKEDVRKIFLAIEEELRIAKSKFDTVVSKDKRFILRDKE